MGLQSLVPIIANLIQFQNKQRTFEIRCKGTTYFRYVLKFVTLQTHLNRFKQSVLYQYVGKLQPCISMKSLTKNQGISL